MPTPRTPPDPYKSTEACIQRARQLLGVMEPTEAMRYLVEVADYDRDTAHLSVQAAKMLGPQRR